MRSRGAINDSEPIACTGAVYQDFRGAPTNYQRAHRFFCNPWVGVFTLPELALRSCPGLWLETRATLGVTDIVPNYVNHGDSKVEKSGAYPLITEAVKEIVQEQNKGKPVNPLLIQHVVAHELVPKLQDVFEQALEQVRNESDEEFVNLMQGAAPFSPDAIRAMEHASINAPMDPARPTLARQSVEDYLWMSARDASTYRPASFHPHSLQSEIDRLTSLASPAADAASAGG